MLRPIFSIDINTVIGTENLCKNYFKKLYFQVFKFLFIFFIDLNNSVISSTQIACDVKYVHHVIQ